MHRPVIAGNWKMHMTCAQSRDYMAAFLPLVADTPDDRHIVLAPPFTALSTMADAVSGSKVELSSQNVHNRMSNTFSSRRLSLHRESCRSSEILSPIATQNFL